MNVSREVRLTPTVGWGPLALWFLGLVASILVLALAPPLVKIVGVVGLVVLLVCLNGFFIVNPNMSRVLVLFGKYKGTVRDDGFYFVNPFMVKSKVSLRAHNLDGALLKVNDLLGNPIEISAVVVWRVEDTARAAFDVEDYNHYVRVQSEAAIRNTALSHPYDDGMLDGVMTTLRGSTDEVAEELQAGLQQRLAEAGIHVVEARINHLAYAPEIASAMLQRQQAGAIIAARQKIVEGAVGMVEMALEMLDEHQRVKLDEKQQAEMVANLLVVLCSDRGAQPVVHAGT